MKLKRMLNFITISFGSRLLSMSVVILNVLSVFFLVTKQSIPFNGIILIGILGIIFLFYPSYKQIIDLVLHKKPFKKEFQFSDIIVLGLFGLLMWTFIAIKDFGYQPVIVWISIQEFVQLALVWYIVFQYELILLKNGEN